MPGVALGPASWLRHNCPCADCRDPVTGQRLIEITDIPDECGVTVETQTAASVTVLFTPEGHRGVFSRGWLAAHAQPASPDPRTEDGKQLWRAADLTAHLAVELSADLAGGLAPDQGGWLAADQGGWLPGAAWDAYRSDDAVRARCLNAVARLGFALLRGVPPTAGTVLEVARTFGFVRATNYGTLFDVCVIADPANLAYTSRDIPPHTDNPYRDPVPTLQLLHCLRAADIGGDTGLVDGFAAAAALRADDSAAFAILTATPWPFAYADKQTQLSARQPLIALTAEGRITAVRLNNRSMGALRLPALEAAAAYAAYRAWAALLARPEFRLTLRLTPGDCLIFDNTRILHARTAFTAAPATVLDPDPDADPGMARTAGTAPAERHLQGCYADLDGLLSTLAVLRRDR